MQMGRVEFCHHRVLLHLERLTSPVSCISASFCMAKNEGANGRSRLSSPKVRFPVFFAPERSVRYGPNSGRVDCCRLTSAIGSLSDRQLPLQNFGKPTFVQPTAQGELLDSIEKGRDGGKVVENRHRTSLRERYTKASRLLTRRDATC